MSAKQKATEPAPVSFKPEKTFPLFLAENVTHAQQAESVARQTLAPETAAYRIISASEGKAGLSELLDATGVLAALREAAAKVQSGDMRGVEAMLIGQATALQSLSVRLIERGLSPRTGSYSLRRSCGLACVLRHKVGKRSKRSRS